MGFNNNNPSHFLGIITGVREHPLGGEWTASGFVELIRAAPEIRSGLLYRRPIFTATSASSVEDPANVAWRGGIGNLILWRAGGRPYDQQPTYPTALFYYACETAIMAPEWTWLNGGDAASVLDELCRAAGGVVYQDEAGVVRYQEPFSYGTGTPVIHYTDNVTAADADMRVLSGLAQYTLESLNRSAEARGTVVDVVRCAYVARRLQGVQQVYRDTTPRLVEAGAAQVLTLDLSLPCYRVSSVKASAYTMRSSRAVLTTELTIAIGTTYAQQVTVTITNTLSEPIGVSELTVYAMPLVALEEGTASYGTPGTRPRSYGVPDSVYIQSKSHADRLCRMYWDWYATPRPLLTFVAGYDPRRTAGEIVSFTSSPLAESAARYRIVRKAPRNTGVEMELTAAPMAGLPVSADFFILGTTYSDSDSRQVSY
jgi:hypothetical protein